ncbi:hypothetical protein ACW5R3_02175 [Bizionia sp. KMM 8389]
MKNLIRKSLVMFLLLTTVAINANAVDSIRVTNESKATLLVLPDVKEGNLLIIKDIFNETLYEEKIQDSGNYIKRFDLTTLPDGSYYFQLFKDYEVRTIPFSLKANQVTLKKSLETIIQKPEMKTKNNVVYVSKNNSNNKDVKVSIYYNENDTYNLIYSETLNAKNTLKAYKLDENERGNYKMVYTVDGKKFTDYFQL